MKKKVRAFVEGVGLVAVLAAIDLSARSAARRRWLLELYALEYRGRMEFWKNLGGIRSGLPFPRLEPFEEWKKRGGL